MREWRRRRTIICAQPGGNGNLKDAFEKVPLQKIWLFYKTSEKHHK
jgi:hypothetical protein